MCLAERRCFMPLFRASAPRPDGASLAPEGLGWVARVRAYECRPVLIHFC